MQRGEALLQRVWAVDGAEGFDRQEVFPIHYRHSVFSHGYGRGRGVLAGDDGSKTRVNSSTLDPSPRILLLDDDGAGSAAALATAKFCTLQPTAAPDEFEQSRRRVDVGQGLLHAIEVEGYR